MEDRHKIVQKSAGFVNYLARYMPKLSELCEPLRRLRQKRCQEMDRGLSMCV